MTTMVVMFRFQACSFHKIVTLILNEEPDPYTALYRIPTPFRLLCFILRNHSDDQQQQSGIERKRKEGFRSERRSLEEAFQEGSRRVDALVECRSRYLPAQLNDEVDLKT